MEQHARIIEKVQKLLTLAERNTNVNEAAAATAKAQELLFQHKLSMADIELKTGDAEAVCRLDIDEESGRRLKWKESLIAGLAHGCYCKAITAMSFNDTGKRTSRMIIIGKPSDTQTVAYLYCYATGEIDRLAAILCRGRGLAYANSFRLGAAAAISATMLMKRRQQSRTTTEGALVIRRGDEEIDAFVAEAFGKVGNGTRPTLSNPDGFTSGVEAGRSINLGGGVRELAQDAKQIGARRS